MPSNFDLAQTSVEYDNLTISGYPHVVSYSSLDLIPGIPHIDQLEIERIFDTGAKTGNTVFTISDRRRLFKLPKNWYTINETNKTVSILQFSTIASNVVAFNLTTGLGLLYTSLDGGSSIVIPNLGANDTIIIRRKTLSEDKLVSFTAGSRLTSGQLNLSNSQLINILQEVLWKLNEEVIIKYDKDAIDGPFLGQIGGSFVDVGGNIDMNSQRITNLGISGTLSDAMPKSEISDVLFRHGVITKDTAPVSNPGIQNDVIEGTVNEGRSGIWFNPQDGKLRAWAGNQWVIVTNAINPGVNASLVQTNTAQNISGAKTFLAATTFDNTVTFTSNISLAGDLITTDTGTVNVFNTTATTLNIGGAATAVNIGAVTGTTTVRNALAVSGTASVTGTLTAGGNTWPQCVMTHYDQTTTYTTTGVTRAGPVRLAVLDTSIVPRSASSKVLVNAKVSCEVQHNSVLYLVRNIGGTRTEIGSGLSAENRNYGMSVANYDIDNATTPFNIQLLYLDSPATTSSITYEVWFSSELSGTTLYLNRTVEDANNVGLERLSSQVVLQEYFA